MKKISYLLILTFCQIFSLAKAQNEFYFNGDADVIFRYTPRGSGGRAFVHDNGNVLALNFGGDFSGGTRIGNQITLSNDGTFQMPDNKFFKGANFQTNDYSTMTFKSRAWQTVQGVNGKAFSFQTHNNLGNDGFEMMAIYYGESGKITMVPNGGNVGIGIGDTKGYKLAVGGSMIAESIKVKLQANWPDYIFSKGYELPSLSETEKQIKDQGHLPGIPSAAEVKANGIDLGEMNAKLLKKIEELTLYLIELKKDNDKQRSLNLKQQKQLETQGELIREILKKK